MKKLFLVWMLFLPGVVQAQQNYRSEVWAPDNGDGTYTNPVINADYSDPDVCVVGDDYYLTASSFQCIPGLPILHSRDLVNWEIIGHALKELQPREVFDTPSHGNGVWAPSIRYHNGEFYIYWGDPDYGVFMVKATDPAGEWTEPLCVIPGKGMIDTCPLWDDDGRCYLVNGWANSRARFASVITVRELNAEGTRPVTGPVVVFDGNGTENRTCEGPKFYKRDGWYWIMCPAGGVPTGFQLAMRAKTPYGPYEVKKVLAQGNTAVNGPHQGAWVHTAMEEDWFLHFQDKECYGRVVHLQPVTWRDNWPVMGVDNDGDYCGEPVSTYRKPKAKVGWKTVNPVESDEFSTPTTGLQWQWQANYQQVFGMPTAFGTYRIYNHKHKADAVNLFDVPNMFLQKTPANNFTATTKIRLTSKADNQMGGLIMMGLDYSALVAKRMGDEFVLQQLVCHAADRNKPETATTIATLSPTARDVIDYKPGIHLDIFLRMVVANGKCRFFYSLDGKKYKAAGEEFKMREGKWIGAKIGLVSVEPDGNTDRGWVEADWFRVTKK
ncbi:MAG: glycoside hydrolase 43 family protein [Prevotella sp.]|nr:glycoside hydrolase 43 family protein [Prevotella sp.]